MPRAARRARPVRASQAKRHPRRHISEEELRAVTTFLIANAEPFSRAQVTYKVRRPAHRRAQHATHTHTHTPRARAPG